MLKQGPFRKDIDDLDITMIASLTMSTVDPKTVISVDVKAYEVVGRLCTPKDEPLWRRRGDVSDDTSTLEDAEVLFEGYVKWDGCSHWMFTDNRQDTMIHLCGRRSVLRLGQQLLSCWDWCDELLGETNKADRRE